MEKPLSTTLKSKCNICGNNARKAFSIVRHDEVWDIYRCGVCRTEFIYPIPEDTELAKLYDRFYRENENQIMCLNNPNYGILSFPRQWKIIEKLVKKKESRILDYGCGGGHFLDRVSRSWGKVGVEISDRARYIASKKTIHTVPTLEDGKFPDGYFDVIVMFATIEHLPNPKETVEKLNRVLKAGGLFVVMTGDVSSLKAKVQGNNWHLYTPPGHIFYFTRYSVDYLMRSCGYKKIKSLYTDGGVTACRWTNINLLLRMAIEIYHRIPILNTLPIFDCYYGYYIKEDKCN